MMLLIQCTPKCRIMACPLRRPEDDCWALQGEYCPHDGCQLHTSLPSVLSIDTRLLSVSQSEGLPVFLFLVTTYWLCPCAESCSSSSSFSRDFAAVPTKNVVTSHFGTAAEVFLSSCSVHCDFLTQSITRFLSTPFFASPVPAENLFMHLRNAIMARPTKKTSPTSMAQDEVASLSSGSRVEVTRIERSFDAETLVSKLSYEMPSSHRARKDVMDERLGRRMFVSLTGTSLIAWRGNTQARAEAVTDDVAVEANKKPAEMQRSTPQGNAEESVTFSQFVDDVGKVGVTTARCRVCVDEYVHGRPADNQALCLRVADRKGCRTMKVQASR